MLDYYFSILAGEERPRFHCCRMVDTGHDRAALEGMALEGLWEIHDRALGRLKSVKSGQLKEPAGGNAGLLELKAVIARRMLSSCHFCERRCHVDRAIGEVGTCGVPAESRYASEFFHYGEEPELVPSHTIFFTGCTFKCIYCQNWDIATRPLSGQVAEPSRLARIIDQGRLAGSRNVNFVGGNPDSHLHTCLETVGFLQTDVPVVWNSNAYASSEAMKLLDGVVDIFLSDFRYGNDGCARRYSGVARYWEVVTRNLLLASAQAEVMLRHLVLPGHLECCSRPVMEWVSRNTPEVYFNLMFQYRPEHRAAEFPDMDRMLDEGEMRLASAMAREYHLRLRG